MVQSQQETKHHGNGPTINDTLQMQQMKYWHVFEILECELFTTT